jgi:acyl-CoA thioesterase-1
MVLLVGTLLPVTASASKVILVFGDSLSAGYGLARGQSWPDLLQARLGQGERGAQVINASVSGETTAGGVARLPTLLREHQPDVVILELGANDGLRGLPLPEMKDNLARMLKAVADSGAVAVLIPMRIPPNYGPAYANGFAETFAELSGQFERVLLTAFFLQEVALNPALLQADGLHPTAAAQPLMLDAVWPTIAAALEQPNRVTP